VAEVEACTLEFAEGDDGNIDDEHDDANTDDDGNDANACDEGNDATIHHDTNRSSHPDMFDPRCWMVLMLKSLIYCYKRFLKDNYLSSMVLDTKKNTRRFSASACNRELPNGETCDKEWLVYNKELDKIFCFCYKLLRKGHVR
jgi:hypothetical protein